MGGYRFQIVIAVQRMAVLSQATLQLGHMGSYHHSSPLALCLSVLFGIAMWIKKMYRCVVEIWKSMSLNRQHICMKIRKLFASRGIKMVPLYKVSCSFSYMLETCRKNPAVLIVLSYTCRNIFWHICFCKNILQEYFFFRISYTCRSMYDTSKKCGPLFYLVVAQLDFLIRTYKVQINLFIPQHMQQEEKQPLKRSKKSYRHISKSADSVCMNCTDTHPLD